MQSFLTFKPILGVSAVVALLLLAVPTAASAVTPPPPGVPSGQTLTASATSTPSGGVHTNAVLGVSPASCRGYTDYAHLSGTQSSVHGRTKCNFNVTELGVTTTDWNLAWFGWNALATLSSHRVGANNSGDATPHAGCSSTTEQSFYGSSTHYSIESGNTYTGVSSSIVQKFVC